MHDVFVVTACFLPPPPPHFFFVIFLKTEFKIFRKSKKMFLFNFFGNADPPRLRGGSRAMMRVMMMVRRGMGKGKEMRLKKTIRLGLLSMWEKIWRITSQQTCRGKRMMSKNINTPTHHNIIIIFKMTIK